MYLDYLIESMDARLNQRLINVMPLEGLIPANLNMYDDKNIIKTAKIYVQDLHDNSSSTIRADLFIGGNKGVKILFQNRILLLIHSLIVPIFELTLKYFYNYSPRYQLPLSLRKELFQHLIASKFF
jgi:hypothetical protein